MCVCGWVVKILVIIGGINWGLVGVGMLLNSLKGWNLVSLLLGSMPTVEAIVYVLVGLAAIAMIFGCSCKNCKGGCCQAGSTSPEQPVSQPTEGQM